MPNLDTLPAEFQVQITCRALFFAARVIRLGQVYLAARDKTLSTVQAICNEDYYRKRATVIMIEILMYEINPVKNYSLLHEMYLAKQDLCKLGFNVWNLSRAKTEYNLLYHEQEQCIVYRQGAHFRAVLKNASRQQEKIETISITDQFSRWYYSDGALSRNVMFAPFPTYSTPYTICFLTMILKAQLRQTRETWNPNTKSFVADIFGDSNGLSETGGLPYDTIFWGMNSIVKNDDSVFRGVFKGFERFSVDMSLRRHYRGVGEHVQTVVRAVKPAQMRKELARHWQDDGRRGKSFGFRPAFPETGF